MIRVPLRMFVAPRSVLVAGPFAGELGWELMEWQGYVRKLRRRYARTIVITYENSRCLYEGCEFWDHGLELKHCGFGLGDLSAAKISNLVRRCVEQKGLQSYDLFSPGHLNRSTRILVGGQQFQDPVDPRKKFFEHDVAFHFRNFERVDGDFKNYPPQWANEVVAGCKAGGLSVCCIGHPDLALCASGADDRRSSLLQDAVTAISRVRLVAGGSSAPMHLASLYGIPIAVWTGPPFTAERYFASWNPHRSRVFLVTDETFRPTVAQVVNSVSSAMTDLLSSAQQVSSGVTTR